MQFSKPGEAMETIGACPLLSENAVPFINYMISAHDRVESLWKALNGNSIMMSTVFPPRKMFANCCEIRKPSFMNDYIIFA